MPVSSIRAHFESSSWTPAYGWQAPWMGSSRSARCCRLPHAHAARRRDPARQCSRARRDATLMPEESRVFGKNFRVRGVRKVGRQLLREGHAVAHSTVARLMWPLGLQDVIRGKPVRTTFSDKAAPCPLDHVNRQFKAPRPNALWMSDFTYEATWIGFVYVAFVIDAYARASSAGAWRAGAGPARQAADAPRRPRVPKRSWQPACLDQIQLSTWRRRASSRQSAASAIAMTARSPRPSTASTRPRLFTGARLGGLRGCRVRDVGMDRLVQQSQTAGAHRQHPASRSGSAIPRHDGINSPWQLDSNRTASGEPERCTALLRQGDLPYHVSN